MSIIQALFWLLCGASAAAQDFNWNQKLDQLRVQKPAVAPQGKQSFHEPLTWKYPDPPVEEEPRYPPDFQLKPPEVPNTVAVICGEDSVRVEAKRDLLGIGKPVRVEDVTLGGCPVTGEDTEAQILIFESELHRCGSQLLMSDESFIYVFTLLYTPSPLGDSAIVRTQEVTVPIECHYQRKQDVSSKSLQPAWNPFIEAQVSGESLYFSFRLMTDDWQFARPSSQYLLGDMIRFEVAVKQFHHTPLRVTVDSCLVTVVPNIDTVPRYTFMGNNGCLFDSQLTGSTSQFLPRTQDDRLQFELEAFKFQQDDSGVLYVTCNLRATVAAAAVDATNKACSFSDGWWEASGSHQACSCCDAQCETGGQNQMSGKGGEWEQETVVGPINVKERPLGSG
ncbi:zona pellucida sperm-binding protein 3-like [Aulostomus maculatus]